MILAGPHSVTRSWIKPLSFQEAPEARAYNLSMQLTTPHTKSAHWVPSMLQNSAVITYRIRTGSTGCSLLPFPHTCPQLSACHCRSWQTQLHLTPPGTCTPARYCMMLHSVMGSCKPRRKRWHITYTACSSAYWLLGANHFCVWPPATRTASQRVPTRST